MKTRGDYEKKKRGLFLTQIYIGDEPNMNVHQIYGHS